MERWRAVFEEFLKEAWIKIVTEIRITNITLGISDVFRPFQDSQLCGGFERDRDGGLARRID